MWLTEFDIYKRMIIIFRQFEDELSVPALHVHDLKGPSAVNLLADGFEIAAKSHIKVRLSAPKIGYYVDNLKISILVRNSHNKKSMNL